MAAGNDSSGRAFTPGRVTGGSVPNLVAGPAQPNGVVTVAVQRWLDFAQFFWVLLIFCGLCSDLLDLTQIRWIQRTKNIGAEK